MASILNLITVGEKEVLVIDSDPSTGGGLSAPIASIAVYDSGTAGYAFLKVGSLDTDWQQLSTAAGSGFVNPGVAGRLSLFPASSNAVDDVYVQNGQSIDVAIAAQPSRSANIEYVIPNPGNAVTSADFVLTEGAQTINGAKTLTSALAMSSQKITGLADGTTTNDAVNFGQLSLYIPLTQKGANNGVATLDAGGKVPVSQLPNSVMEYQGNWNASTNSPTLADGTGNAGDVYRVNVAGTQNLGSGSLVFAIGDWVVYNGTIWEKSINSNAVVSVNGQTGIVSLVTSDIPEGTNLYFTNLRAQDAVGAIVANSSKVSLTYVSGTSLTANIVAGSLVNADINASAAIAYSKLNLSGSIVNADVSASAAIAYSKLNLSASIVDADISSSAAISLSKLAALTASKLLVSDGSGIISASTGSGFVKSTSGTPSYQASISLTADVSGVLPVANGGTNSSTALNNNRIMVSSAGAIIEAAALTNGQLLIGSTGAAPSAAALTGTTNQVIVTNGAGSITLSLPQDIATTSSPTFLAQTLSGSGAFFELIDAADMKMTTATVNTTNATVTTLATVATTTNTSMLIEAKIVGVRTGGTAGSAGDSVSYIRTARVKNIAGTVTIQNLQSDYTSEDQPAMNGTITVSGTNILVQVQGAANNNVTWKALITKII